MAAPTGRPYKLQVLSTNGERKLQGSANKPTEDVTVPNLPEEIYPTSRALWQEGVFPVGAPKPRELFEGLPMLATGAGIWRKQSLHRPRRALPTFFWFISERVRRHWHAGHTSSSEISLIRSKPRELFEGLPMLATEEGIWRKQSLHRPGRALPTLFWFISERVRRHWHEGHTSSSEISLIRSDDSLRSIIPSSRLAGFLCPAEFPSVRAVVGDVLRAMETPSLDIIFAGGRVAGMSWYGRATSPDLMEVCVIWGEGIIRRWRRACCRRLGSAACDPGTIRSWRAFIYIIMIQKAGVKNASILVLGRGKGWGDLSKELA